MPEPRGRRHPLFLRLTKPIEPIYPDAVTPVAWDDDEPLDEVEGVVYIVTRQCARMRTWARQVRKLHDVDTSYKTEKGVCRLSAAPVAAGNLKDVGRITRRIYNEEYHEIDSVRSAHHLFVEMNLMAVVVDRADGDAVGFVSFALEWTVDAIVAPASFLELEVKADQAWIASAYRGRRWGESAAIAIAFAVRRHLDHLEETTRWPAGFTARPKVTVSADLYSTSGEKFLAKCAEYVSIQLGFMPAFQRIDVTEIVLDGRW